MPYDAVPGSTNPNAPDGGVYNPIPNDPAVLIDAAASESASDAAASAAAALASQLAAAASAAAALVSQGASAASAAAALVSQNAAAASAAAALVSENNAAASATTATTQAGIATTQATNAGNSATAAGTSATNANNSAIAAAASYDSFDDRYLGAKASNPALDNDGDTLLVGAIYFNTVSNEMRVWTGAAWVLATGIAGVSSFNTRTGAVTLTSADVTSALTFTPYNATNPAGYITAAGSITGNAATATALQTARTINGVSFNGTANITVADATKLPLAGGTMAGNILLDADGTRNIGATGTSLGTLFANTVSRDTVGTLTISAGNAAGNIDLRVAGASRTTIAANGVVTVPGISNAVGRSFLVGSSISGATLDSSLVNSSNTANSAVRSIVSVGGALAGDPSFVYDVTGATSWAHGIDNSDNDRWKLSFGAALGTTDKIIANPAADRVDVIVGPAYQAPYTSANRSALQINGPAGGEALVGFSRETTGQLGFIFHNGTNMSISAAVGSLDLSSAAGIVTYGSAEIGYRGLPYRATSGADTAVNADKGRGVVLNAAGNFTIPANVFVAGDVLPLYNNVGSSQTIVQGAGLTMRFGAAGTGNRTLANNGMCSAFFISPTVCSINGSGLT
jgi:hypothetical protein